MRKVDFLGKGVHFPFVLEVAKNGKNKRFSWAEYDESIKQAIFIILGTIPGERLMRPEFGCHIYELIFSPNDANTKAQAIYYVEEALKKWEPRVQLLNVTTQEPEENEIMNTNTIQILIEYEVIADNTKDNLVYPFYLENSGENTSPTG